MATDSSGVTQAHHNDRTRVRTSANRRTVRKPVAARGAVVTAVHERDRIAPMSVLKTIGARPLGRTLSLWILVGALWISLGMIVSATLVTVAFLT